MESPNLVVEAVNRMVDNVQTAFEAAGLTTRRAPGEDDCGELLQAFGPDAEPDGSKANEPSILVLSYTDTVHPIGTKKEANPIRRDGDKLYGPGVYDMKDGVYLAFDAYRRLLVAGVKTTLPVRFMFIPEEERGSPHSRAYIKRAATLAHVDQIVRRARVTWTFQSPVRPQKFSTERANSPSTKSCRISATFCAACASTVTSVRPDLTALVGNPAP